ncbi:hypothetical protein B0H34DRAFT_684406 [Crassisporium funariophilum]|nr:hypothetical protein B0H34DRAFT_684406 [Crassisporium funariophilum]
MIIHSIESSRGRPTPPELHGFPPWQIRLTEIYQSVLVGRTPRTWFRESRSPLPLPLDEFNFREALDEFASAEMRFGK